MTGLIKNDGEVDTLCTNCNRILVEGRTKLIRFTPKNCAHMWYLNFNVKDWR